MSCQICSRTVGQMHHPSCLLYPARVAEGKVQGVRLERDDRPAQGGSASRVRKSNSSLDGLDNRRDDQPPRWFKVLLWLMFILGIVLFGAIITFLFGAGVYLFNLNP